MTDPLLIYIFIGHFICRQLLSFCFVGMILFFYTLSGRRSKILKPKLSTCLQGEESSLCCFSAAAPAHSFYQHVGFCENVPRVCKNFGSQPRHTLPAIVNSALQRVQTALKGPTVNTRWKEREGGRSLQSAAKSQLLTCHTHIPGTFPFTILHFLM